MDFSVYIIKDREDDYSNQKLFDQLAGDIGFLSLDKAKSEGLDVASNVVGVEVGDIYADPKIIGPNGIAISGNMVNSVSIKKDITKREILYSDNPQKDIDTKTPAEKTFVILITVKGSLFAPKTTQHSSSEKMKNMAKVLAWASLPPEDQLYHFDRDPGYGARGTGSQGEALLLDASKRNEYDEDFYFRRVMVTVYSDEDLQFRAVLYDHVYVESYEEIYTDKDGNGSFTLVMKTKMPDSIYDVIVEGPSYSSSLNNNILSVADTALNVTDEVIDAGARTVKTFDNALGLDGKLSGPTDKIAKMAKNLFHDIDEVFSDPSEFFNQDSIHDLINNSKDNVRDLKEEIPELQDKLNEEEATALDTNEEDPIGKAIERAIKEKQAYDDYQKAYDALTDEQKELLSYIPGFDDMSIKDKMAYIDELNKSE